MQKSILALVSLIGLAVGGAFALAWTVAPPSPAKAAAVPRLSAQSASLPALPELPTVAIAPKQVHAVRNILTASGSARGSYSVSGTAKAIGGTTLDVAGKTIRLFGVREASPQDQCKLASGERRSCDRVAQDMLALRLRRHPRVVCHVPAGQRSDPAAICVDGHGIDLGGMLVAEGWALADTKQSGEYLGAQGVARVFQRGLWRYR